MTFRGKKHADETTAEKGQTGRSLGATGESTDETSREDVTTTENTAMGSKKQESKMTQESAAKTATGEEDQEEKDMAGKDEIKDQEPKVNEYYDKWLRTAAEFENFKKRQEKQQADFYKWAVEAMVRDLLPVLDSLERALSHGKESNVPQAFIEGIELSRKNFMDVLERHGVKPILAEGEKFDPNFHEAMMQQENPEAEENTVLVEAQKGYLLHDRLLRPSLVIVSKKPSQDE